MWGDDFLVSLLENIFQVSAIILLLCSFYYYRHFKKIKRERKLTLFEFSIYIITQVAFFLCAGSYLLLFLDRNYWTNDWNCATKKEGTKRLLIITCYPLLMFFRIVYFESSFGFMMGALPALVFLLLLVLMLLLVWVLLLVLALWFSELFTTLFNTRNYFA